MINTSFNAIIEQSKGLKHNRIAFVCPYGLENIEVVYTAEKMQLAEFLLVGDKDRIEKDLATFKKEIRAKIIDAADDKEAAQKAVMLVAEGRADTIMKGLLHSSTFLKAALNKEMPLNCGNLLSQISIIEKPENGLLFLTDCAINIAPSIEEKVKIIKNAVKFAHSIGVKEPKVAVLAPLELVNLNMKETIDAAILSKMGDRGQIQGCLIDGPLAFDNAVSPIAAQVKNIDSKVAGDADIILAPNLTVGNSIGKALEHLGQINTAAATVGLSIPIIFNSRTDTVNNKLTSISLTLLSIEKGGHYEL